MTRFTEVSWKEVGRVIPKRSPESHKGNFGKVLVVGGGSRYVGAPALAAVAALRTGSDLAIVAAPEKTAWAINAFSPDLITIKLHCEDFDSASVDAVIAEARNSNSLIVGPGIGNETETMEGVLLLLRELREKCPLLPATIDADALKILSSHREISRSMPWVLTPHAGELGIMLGGSPPSGFDERKKAAVLAAKEFGCTLLLKGRIDVVVSPNGEIKLSKTGNPGMTVGGTGDVLSGIVGSLMGQGLSPFQAAWAGVWICGRAGDLCMKEKGYEFIASDLLDKIPEVFKEIRGKRGGKIRGR